MKRIHDPLLARFIKNIDVRGDDECWNWTAGRFSSGYGQFRVGENKVRVHRIAYLARNGDLPRYNEKGEELYVCHHCDNKICCNPDHLFLGTSKDNTRDAYIKKRITPGEGNPNAILRNSQVRLIKKMLSNNIPHRKIAVFFNVSKGAISNISAGNNWIHI